MPNIHYGSIYCVDWAIGIWPDGAPGPNTNCFMCQQFTAHEILDASQKTNRSCLNRGFLFYH